MLNWVVCQMQHAYLNRGGIARQRSHHHAHLNRGHTTMPTLTEVTSPCPPRQRLHHHAHLNRGHITMPTSTEVTSPCPPQQRSHHHAHLNRGHITMPTSTDAHLNRGQLLLALMKGPNDMLLLMLDLLELIVGMRL